MQCMQYTINFTMHAIHDHYNDYIHSCMFGHKFHHPMCAHSYLCLFAGSNFTVGEYLIVYTAIDPSGNNGTCSFGVTVSLAARPTSILPAAASSASSVVPIAAGAAGGGIALLVLIVLIIIVVMRRNHRKVGDLICDVIIFI